MSSASNAVPILALAALALMSACSSDPVRSDPFHRSAAPGASVVRHGTVTAIDVIAAGSRAEGAGALLDSVVGAPVHHQAGNGIGRATLAGFGIDGGSMIGNQVERRDKNDSEVYRVTVRLDDGRIGQFDCQRIDDLRVGHRVRIEGGRLFRV